MGQLGAITWLLVLQQLMELELLLRPVQQLLLEPVPLMMRHTHHWHIRLIHHMSCMSLLNRMCCRYHMMAGSMLVRSTLALASGTSA